jgi:hypothetical protein
VKTDLILNAYKDMAQETLSAWELNSTVGRKLGLPENYYQIGLSLGKTFYPPPKLYALLNELQKIAKTDPSLKLIPNNCNHFTFLALSDHLWKHIEELPKNLDVTKQLIEADYSQLMWRMKRLRLVAGPNYLLLAGVPDPKTWKARQEIAKTLMSCNWREQLKFYTKNQGQVFPPLIWHSTLCRYEFEYFSPELRIFFEDNKHIEFEDILLGPPEFRAVNYDWSFSVAI